MEFSKVMSTMEWVFQGYVGTLRTTIPACFLGGVVSAVMNHVQDAREDPQTNAPFGERLLLHTVSSCFMATCYPLAAILIPFAFFTGKTVKYNVKTIFEIIEKKED